jgi:hypothetical protein
MNEEILAEGNLVINRFFNLDSRAYDAGVLDVRTKELLGLVASLVLVVAALSTAATTSAAPAPTSLRISYWDDGGVATPTEVWTLRCNPAGGTLPRPARACRKLAAGGEKLFAPLRPDTACTQIYGGPQKARVVGTVAGRRVRATFSRSDGCQISRWNALAPWLLPPGGVTR